MSSNNAPETEQASRQTSDAQSSAALPARQSPSTNLPPGSSPDNIVPVNGAIVLHPILARYLDQREQLEPTMLLVSGYRPFIVVLAQVVQLLAPLVALLNLPIIDNLLNFALVEHQSFDREENSRVQANWGIDQGINHSITHARMHWKDRI